MNQRLPIWEKIKKNNNSALFAIIFSAISAAISIATTFLVAKPIGSSKYGNVQYYIGIISTFSTIITFGFASFLVKNSQFEQQPKQLFTKCLILMTAFSVVLFPAFFLICYFFLSEINKDWLLILQLFACSYFTALCSIVGPYLIGLKKSALGILLETLLPRLLLFSASLVFVFLNAFDEFVVYYPLIYLCSFATVSLSFLPFVLKKPSKLQLSKKNFAALSIFFILNFSSTIQSNLSKIILGEASSSFDNVGIFSLCLQIVTMGTLFSGVITSIARPEFSNLAQKGDVSELFSYFRKVMRINCYIAVPFLIAFAVESKNILVLFGTDYAKYPLMMVLLALGFLASNISGPIGTMLVMAGHEKLELINALINMAVYFALGFGLAKQTIYGLPIAIIASNLVVSIVKYFECFYIYKKNPYSIELVLQISLMVAVSTIVFYDLSFVSSRSYWIILNILIGSSMILCNLFLSPHKDDRSFFFANKKSWYLFSLFRKIPKNKTSKDNK